MKRCISLILVVLCINLFSISSYANSIISESEAKELIDNAAEVIFNHIYTDLDWDGEKPRKELNPNCGLENYSYEAINPTKLIGGSLEGFYDHLKTIYTDVLAQKYCQKGYLYDSPMFVIDQDGDLFKAIETPFLETFDIWSLYDNAKVELIDANAKTASAKVYLTIFEYISEDNPFRRTITDAWVECKFENTPSGWRISDCAYFDMLNSHKGGFEWTPVNSPSTGDENGVRIWWLAGVSFAALVPAACLLRRRRRED